MENLGCYCKDAILTHIGIPASDVGPTRAVTVGSIKIMYFKPHPACGPTVQCGSSSLLMALFIIFHPVFLLLKQKPNNYASTFFRGIST